MATVSEFIADTLRKLTVQGIAESGDPEQVAHALRSLNRMMHAWKLRGVDVYHTELELADEFPLDPEFEEGALYLLAERIAPDFSRPASFDPDDWFRDFQAAYRSDNQATMPRALYSMPSQTTRRQARRA